MPPNSDDTLLRSSVRDVEKLFKRFTRYTRFVLFSKWFLGVFAILLMASLIAWPLISRDRAGVRITFSASGGAGDVASPVMQNPQYEGTDKKGQQFHISGTRAVQKTPELIVIEKVEGQMIKSDNGWVGLTADSAEYVQKENRIELIGNVTVTNDQGYVFITPRAHVDTKTMRITGNEQIDGAGPQGKLLATGFEIGDNGSTIRFGGANRVRMQLDKMKK